MKRNLVRFFAFLMLTVAAIIARSQQISLAGQWRFNMDASDKGIAEKWFLKRLPETIKLPGSMLENNKGNDVTADTKWTGSIYDSSWYFNPKMAKYRQPGNIKFPFWLTPAKYYVGAAWYQREVLVPAAFQGKRIVLSLERPHSETRVWVDDKEVGKDYAFCTAQEFDLTNKITPGKHTITLLVDNRVKDINVGPDSHSITDHTQGNWNGVLGKMLLTATPKTWLDDVQVYPDLENKKALVKINIKSLLADASGSISLSAKSFNSKVLHTVKPVSVSYITVNGNAFVSIELPMGDRMQTWDEFTPALYMLTATLVSSKGVKDERKIQFGMREFKINGTRFEVNGRLVHLRGTVEDCIFPLTGYAPMDTASWGRVFRICKAYGLNHMRFHSYCPPEAAFIAADMAGFYLQPEGPSWANHGSSLGDGKPIDQFIYDETNRMAKAYGNYASYCMLAYGNEPRGGRQVQYLTKFVHYWKDKDIRRVYTGASVGQSWPLVPDNEFMVKAAPRGLKWNSIPESNSDYHASTDTFYVPYITHEMGQWCVYPNFKEIKKYTGVYKAKNFELFQADLNDQGMGDQSEKFLMASGKLQALCYKAEIEKSLRTNGAAGFQLLQLNDYPGQGTALVGLLDAFWGEKGYINAKQFSRFCNSTVPLIRTSKFVYNKDEVLIADVEMYHFGEGPFHDVTVTWQLKDESKKIVASGDFKRVMIPFGNGRKIGTISQSLTAVDKVTKLNLEVAIQGTKYANDWDFWVYPKALPQVENNDVYYCTSLDEKAKDVLDKGGKVFLNASGKIVKGREVVMNFTPVFWNTSWFKMRPPHTLGILVDPAHPMFNDFPTAYHSDFNWWDVLNKAQVMHLEDFPKGFRPVVQPIDTWFLNRRLGVILEAKVGNGKLVVSSADLSADTKDRPAATQLYFSIQRYMMSAKFNPPATVDFGVVKDLFETGSKLVFNVYTNGSPDELRPKANIVNQ
jgi:Glycosyl hydrolases family 2, sugar binding domain/Glycosyl hydrolases family 2